MHTHTGTYRVLSVYTGPDGFISGMHGHSRSGICDVARCFGGCRYLSATPPQDTCFSRKHLLCMIATSLSMWISSKVV